MRASVARDPRMRLLSRRLGGAPCLAAAVGYVELLVHLTSERAPDGGVGALSDEEIEAALEWAGECGALVGALVSTGWLASHPDARLVVADWPTHAADWVHARVAQARQFFVDGAAPRLTRIAGRDRDAIRDYYATTCAHGPRRDCVICTPAPSDDVSADRPQTVRRRLAFSSPFPFPTSIPISRDDECAATRRTQDPESPTAAAPPPSTRREHYVESLLADPEARNDEPDDLLDELREFAAERHPEVPDDAVTQVYSATMALAASKMIPPPKWPALLRRELFRVAARRQAALVERHEREVRR